jgi:hypothetical protein
MNSDNFCYWLRGFTELRDNTVPPTAEQWLEIQRHLKLVFNRQDATAPNLNTVSKSDLHQFFRPNGGLADAVSPNLTC